MPLWAAPYLSALPSCVYPSCRQPSITERCYLHPPAMLAKFMRLIFSTPLLKHCLRPVGPAKAIPWNGQHPQRRLPRWLLAHHQRPRAPEIRPAIETTIKYNNWRKRLLCSRWPRRRRVWARPARRPARPWTCWRLIASCCDELPPPPQLRRWPQSAWRGRRRPMITADVIREQS